MGTTAWMAGSQVQALIGATLIRMAGRDGLN